jgi:hypothetical protein
MTTILVGAAAAGLVAVVIVLVAWPFVSDEPESPERSLGPRERRRLELAERRDAAYQGLRELEEDHRTGKVTGEDYEAERAALRAEAAEALRGLDNLDRVHKED